MDKKRKTQRYLNTVLLNKRSRLSVPHLAKYYPIDSYQHKMIRQIVQELLGKAQYSVYIKETLEDKYTAYDNFLNQETQKYFLLNEIGQEPHVFNESQPEPSVVPLYIQGKDSILQGSSAKKKNINIHHIKQKSQSCDESVKKKEKYFRQFQQKKKCTRNEFISIKNRNRASENEDHSEQIQQLLRRKKELILEVRQEIKQPSRTNTQGSKTFSLDKKQRKAFGMNDEGQIIELIPKYTFKVPRQSEPVIKLTHIKVLSGQHSFLQTSMKKKPIIQLTAVRRNKKRKDIGDTCVLIEQMYENDNSLKLDQQQLIQQACRANKGIRFSIKQEQHITSIIRLPTLR